MIVIAVWVADFVVAIPRKNNMPAGAFEIGLQALSDGKRQVAFDQSVLLIDRARIVAAVPGVNNDEIGVRRSRSDGNARLRRLRNGW